MLVPEFDKELANLLEHLEKREKNSRLKMEIESEMEDSLAGRADIGVVTAISAEENRTGEKVGTTCPRRSLDVVHGEMDVVLRNHSVHGGREKGRVKNSDFYLFENQTGENCPSAAFLNLPARPSPSATSLPAASDGTRTICSAGWSASSGTRPQT